MSTKLSSTIFCTLVLALVSCADTTSKGDPVVVMGNKAYSQALTIYDDIYEFQEGLCRVRKDKKYGFIDKKGKEIIPCRFEGGRYSWEFGVGHFSEGMAWFMQAETDGNNKYGFINRKGDVVIPANYESVENFSEGLAQFEKNNKYGFLDKKGDVVIEPIYKKAASFSEGLACVKSESKYGYINKKGELVIPATYSEANNFSEGLATVGKKGKEFVINQKNEVQFTLQDDFWFAGDYHDGLILVCKHGSNWDGDDDLYGYMNATGELVIPTIYEDAEDFEAGKAAVEVNDDEFYIDTKGNVVG